MFYLIQAIILALLTIITFVMTLLLGVVLFCIYRRWNQGKNKELFNGLLITTLGILLVAVLKKLILHIFRFSYFPYEVYLLRYLSLPILAILITVILFGLAQTAHDDLYESNYFNRLSQKEVLQAEFQSTINVYMKEIQNLTHNYFKPHNEKQYTHTRPSYNKPSGVAFAPGSTPAYLNDHRSFFVYLLLSILTLGVYNFFYVYEMARSANIACAGDGEHTTGLLSFILLNLITCGFYNFYWQYALANRLSSNGPRYGYPIQENGTTILLWLLFGSWICGIGLLIAIYLQIKNMNIICAGYNQAVANHYQQQ